MGMSSAAANYLLAEFSDLNSYIKTIWKSSSRIKYTCFDVSRQYIIFGSTSGGLYVFNRTPCHFLQLIPNQTGPINQIRISHDEEWLAFSTQNGLVYVVRRPAGISSITPETQISYEHVGNEITALEWDYQNAQLFIGDDIGKVSVLNLHYLIGKKILHVSSFLLLELSSPIVQLDVSADLLLVSSIRKTVLCNTQKQEFRQVGLRPRHGKYGSCFTAFESTGNIYCARPGRRLWEVDSNGSVICTHKFKNVEVTPTPVLQAFEDVSLEKENANILDGSQVPSTNFTQVYPLMDKFILTYTSEVILILDPSSCEVVSRIDEYSDIIKCVIQDNVIYVMSKCHFHEIHFMTVEELIVKCYYMRFFGLCASLSRKHSCYLAQRVKHKEILSKLLSIRDALIDNSTESNIETIFGDISFDNPSSEESSNDEIFEDEILYERNRIKHTPRDEQQNSSAHKSACTEIQSTPDSDNITTSQLTENYILHNLYNELKNEIQPATFHENISTDDHFTEKPLLNDILLQNNENIIKHIAANPDSLDKCVNIDPLSNKEKCEDQECNSDIDIDHLKTYVSSMTENSSSNKEDSSRNANEDQLLNIDYADHDMYEPNKCGNSYKLEIKSEENSTNTANAEMNEINKDSLSIMGDIIDTEFDYIHLDINTTPNTKSCSSSISSSSEIAPVISCNVSQTISLDNTSICEEAAHSAVIDSLYTVIKEARQNECTIPHRLPILVEYDSTGIVNIFKKLHDHMLTEERDPVLTDYECSMLFLQFIILRLDILDTIDVIQDRLIHSVVTVESRRSRTCVCGYPIPNNTEKPLFYGLCKKVYDLFSDDINKRIDLCGKIPYMWHLIVDNEADPAVNMLSLIMQLDYKKGFDAISKTLTEDDYVNIIDYKLTLGTSRCLLCFSKFENAPSADKPAVSNISWKYIGKCMYRTFGGAKTLNILINKSNELPQGSFELEFYHYLMLNP